MPGFVVRPPARPPSPGQAAEPPLSFREQRVPVGGGEGPAGRGPRHVRRLLTSSKGGGRGRRPGNFPRWRRPVRRPGRRGGGDGGPRGPERGPRRPALRLRRGDRPLLTRLAPSEARRGWCRCRRRGEGLAGRARGAGGGCLWAARPPPPPRPSLSRGVPGGAGELRAPLAGGVGAVAPGDGGGCGRSFVSPRGSESPSPKEQAGGALRGVPDRLSLGGRRVTG